MIKINMGCGWRDFGSDWDHVDGGDYPHLDSHSILELPYEDNTVDLIYASHVLEYFDRKEGTTVLNEWHRVLKPGGRLRVAVPDFQSMVELYLNKGMLLEEFLGPLYGKMEMGCKNIYHKTTYDFNSLQSQLKLIGFKEIKKYDWRNYAVHVDNDDHSQAYIPHMDKESGTLISLNMEAIKYEL